MNLNLFFIFLIAGLLAIFVYFKPLKIKEKIILNLPQLELTSFTLYELDEKGLNTLMKGDKTLKYSDRYEVYRVNYTDNLKNYRVNIDADYGIYKDDEITLNGNIKFKREDGLTFKTDKALYSKRDNLLTIDSAYESRRGKDTLIGSSLEFNNKLNSIKSSNVTVVYQLEESFNEI